MSVTARHAPDLSRTQAKALAQRMASEWRPSEIHRYLNRRGISVAESTVRRWVDPEYNARERSRVRRGRALEFTRNEGRLGRRDHSPEFKMARIRGLYEAGLRLPAIARTMRFDFGESLTRSQLEYALKTDRYPLDRRAA